MTPKPAKPPKPPRCQNCGRPNPRQTHERCPYCGTGPFCRECMEWHKDADCPRNGTTQ